MSNKPLRRTKWVRDELGGEEIEPSSEPLISEPAPEISGFLTAVEPYSGYSWVTDATNLRDPVTHHHPEPQGNHIVTLRSWLRDACTCERCVDPSSGQKRFASADVPDDLKISALTAVEGSLEILWENDFLTGGTHRSTYPRVLWRNVPTWRRGVLNTRLIPTLWNGEAMKKAETFCSFQAFKEDKDIHRSAIKALHEYGLVFLHDVPASEESVKEIAAQIGVIQNTFYGTTWDVVSKPNAENVAYTNSYLGLHQDLLYMRSVPRIQILHCLKNTCEGGESLFGDGYHAKSLFRKRHPQYVPALRDRGVLYGYNKGGNMYEQMRPTFGREGIWWSPPFQSHYQGDYPTLKAMELYSEWLEGARLLKDIIDDEENIYEYKMQPGDCAIFDNHRLLHGRRAFDTSSGERWLKGAYVDTDSFFSKTASLQLISTWVSRDGDDPDKFLP